MKINSIQVSDIWGILSRIDDPELQISITNLGMVDHVEIKNINEVYVSLLPSFIACPAQQTIRKNVEEELTKEGFAAKVSYRMDKSWSSKFIDNEGEKKLKELGIQIYDPALQMSCPYCSSFEVTQDNMFGPTLCRSSYHCNHCHTSFELIRSSDCSIHLFDSVQT